MTDQEIVAGYALRSNLEVSLLSVVKAMKKYDVQSFSLVIDGVVFNVSKSALDTHRKTVFESSGGESISISSDQESRDRWE